jgi:hypothetical protein
VSAPTPLLDFFRRGEAPPDVRLMAAQGLLAPRAEEQLALLIFLLDDRDADIRAAAQATLDRIPEPALSAFLARPDVAVDLREFFADRGVFPAETPPIEIDDPLVGDSGPEEAADSDGDVESVSQRLAKMGFSERLKAAIKGSREMRSLLIRDPNKMIAVSVLSSPKVNEQEVETYSRMANVSDDVLRTIATNRAWTRHYGIVLGLTRNPKTPVALSLNLMARLTGRDLQTLSIDRNVPEPLRVAARRRVMAGSSHSDR